ncbi:hypothetical protein [Lacipirellula sp.]|uniref:hypothetical protein n=1 Tax=Lacipirellula sp. TaxID=2691419 RepID=UPI003D124BA6
MARRRRLTDDDQLDVDELPSSRRARRRRGGRWKFLSVLGALIALAVAAPTIIANSPLRNSLLAKAVPATVGRLTARDAVFSWTGSQALGGVVFIDAKGTHQFEAESIQTNRSLIGFLSNANALGKITLTRPVLHVETRDGGSSVEDLVAQIAAAAVQSAQESGGGPSAPKSFEVEIVDGMLVGHDLATGQQWQVVGLAATAKPLPSAGWDVVADGVMRLGPPATAGLPAPAAVADQAGRFKFHLAPAAPVNGAPATNSQTMQLIADRLPLAPIEPWLARVLPGAKVTGDASADLNVAWALPPVDPTAPVAANSVMAPGGWVAAKGNIDAANLRFTAVALSGDLLELASTAIKLDATLAGDRLTARNCTANGDWLQAQLNGEFNLQEIQQLSLKSLPTSDATITARAELPQLTRMLPRTLRLRPGVQVDAGSMEITARSEKTGASRTWTAAAALQNLVGTDGQRPIRWTKPFEVGVDAIETAAGPQLQRALLRSTFASATADGTSGGLEGNLEFNLAELAEELGQFQDLSAWQLQGTGSGKFSIRDTGADRFAAGAELDLQQIDVRRAGKVVWNDPQVRVEIQADGSRLQYQPQRIDKATLSVIGPDDRLAAELLEPINLADANRSWFVKISGNGPLERWAGRLRPWVAGVPEQLAGQSTIDAQLRAAPGLLQVDQSQFNVKEFAAQVGTTRIVEQEIQAAGDFRWEAATRQFTSKAYQLSSSSIAFGTREVSVQFADVGPPTARGEVAFRGDFDRMSAWGDLLGGPTSDGVRPRGQFEGLLQLASDAQRATATIRGSSAPFQLVNAADGSLAWNEPRIDFATQASYTNADDRLQLSDMHVTGKTMKLDGGGSIDQLRTAGLVKGDINFTYDAAELARLLTAYLGPNIQITGANQAKLVANGQLYASASPASPGGSGGAIPGVPIPTNGSGEAFPTTPPLNNANEWNGSAMPISTTVAAPTALPISTAPLAHWSRRWTLDTATGWSAANVFGLPIGPAQLNAKVQDGQANFTPLQLTVGETGRVSLTPRVLLDANPQVLELASGQTISNVAISPEVSERMLKYAAPIIAGAARTEGSFSFFLNEAKIPLRQPKAGRLDGRLTVHNLAVTPGPMIQNIAVLIQQIDALSKNSQNIGQNLTDNLNQGLGNINQGIGGIIGAVAPNRAPTATAEPIKGLTMSEKAIDVTIVDGRVYHKNLEFLIDDVPVRSNGSVGFDETLNIVIEVPIQQKWVGSKPALQSLVGQVIQIPVTGTFAKPQVDNRAVGSFVTQAAQQAAGGIIGEELNKAFDKILKPR